jgi:flavin-dependent dehydrogenase
VTGLLRDRAGRVAGVRATTATGTRVDFPAAMTVGADGIRSLVAREAGARVAHQGRTASAVLYRYVGGLDAAGYEWAYGDHAGAGLIPTNDGRTCVFVGTSPERMRPLRRGGSQAAFDRLLSRAGAALEERVRAATPESRLLGWGGVPGHLRQPSGPGWALVGDAGYYRDPITTHGISDALRDAELLADAVLAWCSGVRTEAVALARYQELRDRLSRRLLEATEEVAGYGWDAVTVQALLRRVSSAMSDEVDHLQSKPLPGAAPDTALMSG